MESRTAIGVFLLILLLVCVILLAYNFNYSMYSITDASGAKINATTYNSRNRPHHSWRDNRTHGDQWHRYY